MKRLVPTELRGDHPAQLAYFARVLENGCWEYTGYVPPTGYGRLGKNVLAHRLAWEIANGRPVPEGLVIDHTCHNADPDCTVEAECRHRRCVNPDHLEAVPSGTNVLRGKGPASRNAAKTHCKRGHELTPLNTFVRPGGERQCRTCARLRRGLPVVPEEQLVRQAPLPCGTNAAANRHAYRNEPLCEPCRLAHNEYVRVRTAARKAVA